MSIGGESFAELLARVRETDLGAFGHADVPFERLVEVLNPARSQARHPLFQVMLSFQNLAQTEFELPGLTVSGLEADIEIGEVRSAGHPRRQLRRRRRRRRCSVVR